MADWIPIIETNRKCDLFDILHEKYKDTKRAIRSRNSKYIHYNGQRGKNNRTNNDLQNTTYKTKDWATRTSKNRG
jgi:hypothetical protein